jgi:Mrp family chromosome partitioning ATPase
LRLPWTAGGSKGEAGTASANGENGHANTSMALWDPTHHLDPYTTGLSERLMTYFEVNDKNLKKPKLVGFTACARGSGVTTLASGLAACLSKTGNGNVLFVDMNSENGEARSFHEGKAGCGLTDALEPGAHAQAQVEENLFVATINQNVSNKLVKAEPNRFASLMPKIKTSDYDYIIFDLPPVSQTNSTARLAGYMDITLLVLESEKTGKQAAAQATALMRDARANVATVLNKCPQHVPARLSQDL